MWQVLNTNIRSCFPRTVMFTGVDICGKCQSLTVLTLTGRYNSNQNKNTCCQLQPFGLYLGGP
jgi:hypothetical protein